MNKPHSEKTKSILREKAITRLKDPTKNPNWNGGIKINHGYRYSHKPSHPFANKEGYVYEHRLVMEEKIGRYLNKEEKVHHINHVKTDNRPENLELASNHREHLMKYHADHLTKAWEKAPYHNMGNRWSMNFEKCITCGTTKRKHHGKGMCSSCRGKFIYINRFHNVTS